MKSSGERTELLRPLHIQLGLNPTFPVGRNAYGKRDEMISCGKKSLLISSPHWCQASVALCGSGDEAIGHDRGFC